jgi:hypothetical protein
MKWSSEADLQQRLKKRRRKKAAVQPLFGKSCA